MSDESISIDFHSRNHSSDSKQWENGNLSIHSFASFNEKYVDKCVDVEMLSGMLSSVACV